MSAAADPLASRAAAALDQPVPGAVEALVAALHQSFGIKISAILFYGSCRRGPGQPSLVEEVALVDEPGLVDLYVLHEGVSLFHENRLLALLNWLLPPHVMLVHARHADQSVRAKVAILSRRQFERRMRFESLDTTIWARFCQPASLPYARDATTRRWLETAIGQGMRTAAHWALRLAPAGSGSEACWIALFRRTYAAELRPEGADRPALVYAADAAWFDHILAVVRREDAARPTGGSWAARRGAGKVLNLLRLAKAAFTFAQGADYIAWKIGRHTGRTLPMNDWQRRHPLLAAPALWWRWRRGANRKA